MSASGFPLALPDYAGYCVGTLGLSIGVSSCLSGDGGSWQLRQEPSPSDAPSIQRECLKRCDGCERCRFISYTPKDGTCTWHYRCHELVLEPIDTGHRTCPHSRAYEQLSASAEQPSWLTNASAAGAATGRTDDETPDGQLLDNSMDRRTDWRHEAERLPRRIGSRESWGRYLHWLYGGGASMTTPYPPEGKASRLPTLDVLYGWPTYHGGGPTLPPRCPAVWGAPYLGRVVHAPRQVTAWSPSGHHRHMTHF